MISTFLFLVNKPFIWFTIASIYLAYLYPGIGSKGGLLKPEITVKYVAVSIIFFISGLSLKSKELAAAACQYQLHIFIQCFTLIFIPLVVQLLVLVLGELYSNQDLLMGFITVSCMPPPVSSAVILTKAVGGNEAAAVFNSALGSFLGIILTPGLLFLFLGSSSGVPFWKAVFQLSMTVIVPVMAGQCSQFFIENFVQYRKKQLSVIGSSMLLLIMFSTFCETFSQNDLIFTFSTIVITLATVIILQCTLMGLVFFITMHFNSLFTPDDIIAALFCATHKSLTLGFPMLKILYEGEQRFLLISFPLLIYHPTQILIGSLLVPFLQNWMQNTTIKGKTRLYPV